ncbi:hypothetical protein [Polynucleobacter sp. AP-Melu-500A-A1]|uniref:hypothetical protein n=1 Tax=Polynucleobacter sp. AP-Melu-500A-A1 TaxID=2576929 RepID=UPI001C0B8853|nr:hypothetical protein [Polynucleobacter sp. AP-Melu-500A-A1]MBU3631319.1 hypothetical protein [Polynucleobacter sp. AP-Melu-500A-A1]
MPSSATGNSVRKTALAYLILLFVSSCLSLFLFMRNPWLASDLNTDSYVWFLEFSRTIFQSQSAYYAESILLPLLAKILGATQTLITYKLLCGLLTVCILPITAIFAQRYFQNLFKTLLFIILFGLSFQYLQFYILGFPDPLTILLLVLAVFQKRLGVMFALLVLAMLSHFSMAALSVIGLIGLIYFSPNAVLYSQKKLVAISIAAILAGKAFLLAWYAVFHYQLLSRLDWALGKGYIFFLERYETNMAGFWLTPGIPFLALYFLIAAYFLMQKKFAFVFSALLALAITYVALFWTVDGLRVFAVVIAAPYAYLLLSFINSLPFWKAVK